MKQVHSKVEDQILFDSNQDSLKDMNLTEHLVRLDQMAKFLTTAINNHRDSLTSLKEVTKGQIASLKTSYQVLQNHIKQQLERQKQYFQPNLITQRSQISQMKNEVQKINSQQLSTKKVALNIQADVSKKQNQIGFIQLQNK